MIGFLLLGLVQVALTAPRPCSRHGHNPRRRRSSLLFSSLLFCLSLLSKEREKFSFSVRASVTRKKEEERRERREREKRERRERSEREREEAAMKAVDNTVRRKWDVEDFEAKAKERSEREKQDEKQELTARQKKYRALDPLHQGRIKERSALERQDVKPRINYAANVGKTQVVNLIGDKSKQGGFYCEVCDILMKDSLAFADHLNGKMHQRLLGMTMRTERVSVNSVKDKFAALKRQREESGTRDPEKEYESRMAKAVEEDEAKRQARKKAKLVKKTREREEKERQKAEEEQEVDEDLMAAMGFGGFGTSKK